MSAAEQIADLAARMVVCEPYDGARLLPEACAARWRAAQETRPPTKREPDAGPRPPERLGRCYRCAAGQRRAAGLPVLPTTLRRADAGTEAAIATAQAARAAADVRFLTSPAWCRPPFRATSAGAPIPAAPDAVEAWLDELTDGRIAALLSTVDRGVFASTAARRDGRAALLRRVARCGLAEIGERLGIDALDHVAVAVNRGCSRVRDALRQPSLEGAGAELDHVTLRRLHEVMAAARSDAGTPRPHARGPRGDAAPGDPRQLDAFDLDPGLEAAS